MCVSSLTKPMPVVQYYTYKHIHTFIKIQKKEKANAYHAPLLDLELCHMLDGDLDAVADPDPGVHDPEAALPQHGPNLVTDCWNV